MQEIGSVYAGDGPKLMGRRIRLVAIDQDGGTIEILDD